MSWRTRWIWLYQQKLSYNKKNLRKVGNWGWRLKKPTPNPEKTSKGLKKFYETHSSHFKGKKHSQETKRIISEKSKIHQKGEGNSQYGTIWINDGIINKKIINLENIPKGWYKGRIIKSRERK